MSQQYLGEIKLFAFAFAPKGWAQCNGQLLSIAQNQALFSLLGTTYGGNGQTTFALPDIRGRHLVGEGPGYTLGQIAGEQAHTLISTELPAHNHLAMARAEADGNAPSTDVVWAGSPTALYGTELPPSPKKDARAGLMAADALTGVGGSQPHENRPPELVMNYCIALVGIYPSRN